MPTSFFIPTQHLITMSKPGFNYAIYFLPIMLLSLPSFYLHIAFYYKNKLLFYVIDSRSYYGSLVDILIPYKTFLISCIYALKLLILRLQTRLHFLHKLLIDINCIIQLANFYLNALKNINWSIF